MTESAGAKVGRPYRYYLTAEEPTTHLGIIERDVLREAPGVSKGNVTATLGCLVLGIMIFAPLGGWAAIAGSPDVVGWRGRGFDIDVGIVYSGVCFAVSVLGIIFYCISWLQSGRRREGANFVLPIMTIISAVVANVMMLPGFGVRHEWALWRIPSWIAAAVSAVFIILLLVASRPGPQPKQMPKYSIDPSSLGAEETARLLAIRARILDILVDRGFMSAELAEQGKAMPLGRLHMLDPELAEAERNGK